MTMTIKERINRFCEKYPEPKQPTFFLSWTNGSGKHIATLGCDEENVARYNSMITRTTGKPLYVIHYLYDDETELMECSYAVIKCTVPKPSENRKWTYAERYFIPKEEKRIYDINGYNNGYVIHDSYGVRVTNNGKYFLQYQARLNQVSNMFETAFMALTNNHPDLPPRFENYTSHPWIMPEWFIHTPINHVNSKTQQIIDKLSAKELETPQSVISTLITKAKDLENYWYGARKELAYFDKENNVFRLYSVGENTVLETKRVYCYKGRFITAKLNKDNMWIKNGSFTPRAFNARIVNIHDVYDLPYQSYLKDLKYNATVLRTVNAMRNPEIEQLVKMGNNALANRIVQDDHPTIELKSILGEPVNKNKNICSRYALTKDQLSVINSVVKSCGTNTHAGQHEYYGAVSRLKQALNINTLSSIGNDFLRYYTFMSSMGSWISRIFCEDVPEEKRRSTFIKFANMSDKYADVTQVFYDTTSTYKRISAVNRPNVIPYEVKTYAELVRMHDQLVTLKRLEDEELLRLRVLAKADRQKELEKKMAKVDEKRKELNYEDDDFIIRIPNNLSEIVNEGSTLHHCVGSYTDRHARGDTTILFLRKKSEPYESFYTIELTNINTIQQIHGFGNKWIGNNPEALPTVIRWLRKNNINCSTNILTSTAKGYQSFNSSHIEMPIVDGKKGV